MLLNILRRNTIRSINSYWSLSHRVSKGFSRSINIAQTAIITSTHNHDESSRHFPQNTGKLLVAASLMSIFKKKDEETPEEKMIMIIKQSIRCIQKGELEKAEQMLHLGLRMAQDLNNSDGITYIYDVMANLAMEARQFVKAEKLFANVMQRLFQDGYKENDIKMLHVSAKLAHMAGLQGQFDKAVTGFRWTLEKIDTKLKEMERDEELLELWGLTKNWYGQLLMQFSHFAEARKCFQDSYKVYTELHGNLTEEALMLLNNLAVACTNLDEMKKAEEYLNEAISLAKQIPDMVDEGIYQANLGFLYFKQGLLKEAKETCGTAWRLGMQLKSKDAIDQANLCLEQIEKWKISVENAKKEAEDKK